MGISFDRGSKRKPADTNRGGVNSPSQLRLTAGGDVRKLKKTFDLPQCATKPEGACGHQTPPGSDDALPGLKNT
jgi:hypothetical protein